PSDRLSGAVCWGRAFPPNFRRCRIQDSEAHSMLDWPLVVSPPSKEELIRARAAAGPTGHRAPTRLITHAKRGCTEHIERLQCRRAAVHNNDSAVRWTRQRVAETLM